MSYVCSVVGLGGVQDFKGVVKRTKGLEKHGGLTAALLQNFTQTQLQTHKLCLYIRLSHVMIVL